MQGVGGPGGGISEEVGVEGQGRGPKDGCTGSCIGPQRLGIGPANSDEFRPPCGQADWRTSPYCPVFGSQILVLNAALLLCR